MFALRAVDNSAFRRRIDGPRLAPTYDIHVSFNPSLLGGVFNRSSLNLQLVEMRPVKALPSCKVNRILAPLLQLMIDQVQDDGNSTKEDDLLRELKEVSRLIDTQSVLPTLPVFDSHHHCAMICLMITRDHVMVLQLLNSSTIEADKVSFHDHNWRL